MINGGTGNDTIFADAGADTLNGGDGNDVLVAHSATGLFAGPGPPVGRRRQRHALWRGLDVLSGGAGFDVLQVINDFAVNLNLVATGIEYVVSGFGNDTYSAAGATITSRSMAAAATIRSPVVRATTSLGRGG